MGENLGLKIRNLRKQKGMTLKELAGDRVTAAQISSIENGKCNPSDELLSYIAEKLEVDVEYFTLTDRERMQKKFQKLMDEIALNFDKESIDEVLDRIKVYEENLDMFSDAQRGYYYYCFAKQSYFKEDYDKSFIDFSKALIYYLKTKNYDIISDIYICLGNCSYFNNKYELAFGYYKNSEELIDKGISLDNIARTYYDLALCSIALNRYTLSDVYLNKLKDFIKQNDWHNKEQYLPGIEMMQGNVDFKIKDAEDSFKRFENAYKKYKLNSDFEGMLKAKNNMAVCLWESGKKEQAIQLFKDIIQCEKEINKENIAFILDVYLNLIDCLLEMKILDETLNVINEAEGVMLKQNYEEGIIKILMSRFDFLCKIKDYQRAEDYAFYALDFMEKCNREEQKVELYIKLSQMYKNMGDNKQAIEYLLLSQNNK